MKGNGLHRAYDRLTPEERFRLDILAMARGDKQESERLVRSCPRFNYTMNDRGFTGRWLGALDLALRVYLDIAAYLDRITTIGAVRVALPYHETFARDRVRDAFVEGHRAGARQGWREAGGEGAAPEWPLEGVDEEKVDKLAESGASLLPEILDELERQQATCALTIWRGFGTFCEDRMGLEATKILGIVLGPSLKRIEELEAMAQRLDLEPDAESVEEIRAGLGEAWNLVEEMGV